MPHSFGYRAKTRDLFAKKFGKHGTLPTQTFLKTYRLGQIVDVRGDGSVHKGMPHKIYHGKTGIVWNVTKRAIGVQINKQVRNRIVPKRIHVRIEHVHHSKCRQDFLDRVKANDKKRAEAKAAKTPISLKRTPALPRKGRTVRVNAKSTPSTMYAVPYAGLGW